jgi:hypothetical protein
MLCGSVEAVNQCCGSGSTCIRFDFVGSRRAKMTQKIRKKVEKCHAFEVLDVLI